MQKLNLSNTDMDANNTSKLDTLLQTLGTIPVYFHIMLLIAGLCFGIIVTGVVRLFW